MDRNLADDAHIVTVCVALRKESVDRNPPMCTIRQMPLTSLSARRAWIEIGCLSTGDYTAFVALRKESVDRNLAVWAVEHAYQVALRKESVDRNAEILQVCPMMSGRSPQGERG